MRICFLSRRYWPAVSGMSVYAENLLRELVRRGHEVVLMSQYRGDPAGSAVYGGGPPPADRVPDGVEVVALESVGEQVVPADFEGDVDRMVAAVRELHARKPFDLLHAQYAWPNGFAALRASAELGVPNLVSIQGGDGHWVGSCCRTHERGMRAVLDGAGALLIGSASFADEVRGRFGTPQERFTLVGGATDTTAFTPVRQPGELQDPPVLLFHGRIDRRKGILDLLDAVRALHDDGRELRVVVSGIGPDVGASQERTRELGLEDLVRHTGCVEHEAAPAVYAGADVFVSPTESEGFSNTILEAMASGLPVVSTATVGVEDCVRDGENGLLVPVHDVPALTDALARVLDDSALREALAKTALDEVRTLWSWPALVDRIEDAYAAVLARPVDTSWADEWRDEPVDLDCRFRAAPHLL
ncbi:glycosyltransferase involved in cell wall biosynthesis [Motilibacter rhizosphaerae]|uniref:Glycosyltransferase involved in cell wall biosynthesis n=1 Tax=Motilibacter rhizosphaerae TaxID=598652 RepID=A0A4Q7NUM5_9ACTN|nr:glycosyltransferase family 4 protein [Motilibacter rhizosphaerae]RZS90784.1 glycosyltransferase involved in cell wall biosynthesis [Motilibacter rhizosphaerae]